jgi:DNA-binding PadR family transcriptional regulator
MAEQTLGGFEHQVLLALMRLGGETYSVPIVNELEQLVGRAPAPAAVYVTLRRLERRGLLTSVMRAPEDGVGGRERRVFRAEPEVAELLRSVRHELSMLWDGVEALEP